jgi:hypothetical protein
LGRISLIGIMASFFTACQLVSLPQIVGGRFTIRGSVIKSDSGTPAVNAIVQLKKNDKNKGDAVLTDGKGRYVIDEVGAGQNYALEVKLPNYKMHLSSTFTIIDDDVKKDIVLCPISQRCPPSTPQPSP